MNKAYRFFKLLLKYPFKWLYRTTVIGAENEPAAPYIACANHSSFVDPFLEGLALREQVSYIAKASLQRFRIIHWFFITVGVIPIHRDESDVAAIRTSVNALREGRTVGIYPQGTRIPYRVPEPGEAMGGLGLLATMSHCPVLPIAIVTKAHKPKLLRKTIIVIGKPLTEEDFRELGEHPRKPEIASFCFAEVARLYKEAYATL